MIVELLLLDYKKKYTIRHYGGYVDILKSSERIMTARIR